MQQTKLKNLDRLADPFSGLVFFTSFLISFFNPAADSDNAGFAESAKYLPVPIRR
jgi:hypothetical protein